MIKGSSKRQRCSPLFLILAVSLSLLSTACKSAPEAEGEFPGMPVQLETLSAERVEESSVFVGSLEAARIIEVLPEASGQIEQMLVEAGQTVSAGQTLMVLKPDQARPKYETALVAVEVAIGQRDAALEQIEIAKSERDSAQASVDLASSGIARLKMLVDQGAVAEFKLDEGIQKQKLAQNQLIVAEKQIGTAKLGVQQAETAIRQAQAQAETALVELESKDVVSPISGVVDNLPVKRGDYVSAGQNPVAKVAQTDTLFLNLQVPANRSDQLQSGLSIELIDPTSDALLTAGSVDFVSPTVNNESQTILAKARFLNVDGKLRDGQNVQARLIWETQPGLLIPTTSITRVGGQEFVYLVNDDPYPDGKEFVNLVPVELGEIQGNSYQVKGGLESGDRIAVSNILKLRDGVPILPES